VHKKFVCVFFILSLASAGAYAQAPFHNWSKRFGDTGMDSGQSLAVDDSGNLYTTG